MSHLKTPALPPLQVPWMKLSILRAVSFLILCWVLSVLYGLIHTLLSHISVALSDLKAILTVAFSYFPFPCGETSSLSTPTLSCVMPAPHSMVPSLLATTLPCTPSKMFKRDQHMLMDRIGGGSRSGGSNYETLSLLGSTSLVSSAMNRKGEVTDEKMSPWALGV